MWSPSEDEEAGELARHANRHEIGTWTPAPQRVAVRCLALASRDRLQGMDAEAGVPTLPAVKAPFDPESLDPANLLRRAAVEFHPEFYVAKRLPRRRRGKCQGLPLEEMLYKLQKNPLDPGLGRLTKAWQRRKAKREFLQTYARVSRRPCTSVGQVCSSLFSQLPEEQQTGWWVVYQLSQVMYTHVNGRRRTLKMPSPSLMTSGGQSPDWTTETMVFESWGLLCTWHTVIGRGDVVILALHQECLPIEELCDRLAELSYVQLIFEAFYQRVEALAKQFGLPSCAACMEISDASGELRFHLHAYWGQRVDGSMSDIRPVQTHITWEQLMWDGVLPDISQTKWGKYHVLRQASRCAMYYCLAPKTGSVLRRGSHWPIQELSNTVKVSVTASTLPLLSPALIYGVVV